jgi:uncharacterized membrane protein
LAGTCGKKVLSGANWVFDETRYKLACCNHYILFIAGLVVFVISPAVEKHSWVHALMFGAFFGLITYATYDLTNLATMKDWPILVTIVDLIWGTILAASISCITYFIASKI